MDNAMKATTFAVTIPEIKRSDICPFEENVKVGLEPGLWDHCAEQTITAILNGDGELLDYIDPFWNFDLLESIRDSLSMGVYGDMYVDSCNFKSDGALIVYLIPNLWGGKCGTKQTL